MSDPVQSSQSGPAPKKRGGRVKGSKNKRTLEREKAAALAAERVRALAEAEAKAGTVIGELEKANVQGIKLIKDIGFDYTRLFAGLAAFFAPHPNWTVEMKDGKPVLENGRPKLVNSNQYYDEDKFVKYGLIAMNGARDFAAYESPKLAAVLLEQNLVTNITITGGLPDELDGGLVDAAGNGSTIEIGPADYAELHKPGAGGAGHSTDAPGSAGGAADAPQGAGPDIPSAG